MNERAAILEPVRLAEAPDGIALVPGTAKCLDCGTSFTPRKGGKLQRFCSPECRRAHHDGPGRGKERRTLRTFDSTLPSHRRASRLPDAETNAPAASAGATTIFDWLHDDSICVKNQPAIAVYVNDLGSVTIRREAGASENDDAIIAVEPENLGRLIARLREVSEELDGFEKRE